MEKSDSTPWSKLLPVLVAGMILGASAYSLSNKEVQATQPAEYYTKAEIDKVFNTGLKIDIELLKRLEVVEKKNKIVPPKDSLRLVKNEKASSATP